MSMEFNLDNGITRESACFLFGREFAQLFGAYYLTKSEIFEIRREATRSTEMSDYLRHPICPTSHLSDVCRSSEQKNSCSTKIPVVRQNSNIEQK